MVTLAIAPSRCAYDWETVHVIQSNFLRRFAYFCSYNLYAVRQHTACNLSRDDITVALKSVFQQPYTLPTLTFHIHTFALFSWQLCSLTLLLSTLQRIKVCVRTPQIHCEIVTWRAHWLHTKWTTETHSVFPCRPINCAWRRTLRRAARPVLISNDDGRYDYVADTCLWQPFCKSRLTIRIAVLSNTCKVVNANLFQVCSCVGVVSMTLKVLKSCSIYSVSRMIRT